MLWKATPITIVSGGLGNIIDVSLKQIVPCHNIKVIANYVQFDETGKSKSFAEPGVRVDKSKFFAGQRVRKNILAIGYQENFWKSYKFVVFFNWFAIFIIYYRMHQNIMFYDSFYKKCNVGKINRDHPSVIIMQDAKIINRAD